MTLVSKLLLYHDGPGAALTGTWHSAIVVDTATGTAPGAPKFSALNTVNLRLFADFARLPATPKRALDPWPPSHPPSPQSLRPPPISSGFRRLHAAHLRTRLSRSSRSNGIVDC